MQCKVQIQIPVLIWMNSGAMQVTEDILVMSLATKGETDLTLLVRYWGYEWGNRKFDIYIDDEKC